MPIKSSLNMDKIIRIYFTCACFSVISLHAQFISAQSCRIEGFIRGIGNKSVIFGYQQKGIDYNDTISTSNDHFVYIAKPSDDGQITLTIARGRYSSFWYEPGIINVTGTIEKPYQLIITGTSENNTLTRYNQSISWPYERKRQGKFDTLKKEEQRETLQFIQQHPNSLTCVDLLYWQTIYDEDLVDKYQKLFDNMAAFIKNSYQGKKVAKRLSVLRNQPMVGKPAPLFTLPDTSGHLLSLTTYRGKYVLIDFWGHWCAPCIKSFPKLKQLQQSYIEQLVLVGVAAEFASDKTAWQQTIKANQLAWLHVSELKSDKGEVTESYNITAYPTYFLLDRAGIILVKANDLETIEQKLKLVAR